MIHNQKSWIDAFGIIHHQKDRDRDYPLPDDVYDIMPDDEDTEEERKP